MRLLLGGSPCTYWSIAQKNSRETEAEGLGWELFKNYLIAREKYQPRYFLYENNKSMAAAIKAQITSELGVEPILINSALLSAQNRERYYWTNIPGVTQPADLDIVLRDILETGESWRDKAYTLKANYRKTSDESYFDGGHYPAPGAVEPVCGRIVGRRINEAGHRDDYNPELEHFQRFEVNQNPGKTNTVTTVQKDNMVAQPVRVGTMPSKDGVVGNSQSRRIYNVDGKSRALCASASGGSCDTSSPSTGLYAIPAGAAWRGREAGANMEIRKDAKSNAVIANHQSRFVVEWWDGKTYPVYEVRDGQITIKGKTYPIRLADGFYIIRKLTVTECKRLQTVPDDYIFPVSDTQAYKMLGNGWTVDVIAHILSHAPGITTEPLEVLSMYDGMSCGRIALEKMGASVKCYFATEIDKYAVQTTMANYPDTIQLGDAFQVRTEGWTLEGVADIW